MGGIRIVSIILLLNTLNSEALSIPGTDNLKNKLEGLNATEKVSEITKVISENKDYVKEKLNNTILSIEDDEEEGPIDAKYFDDIYRIINRLSFDENVTASAVEKREVTYFMYTRKDRKYNGTQVSSKSIERLCNYKDKNIVFVTHGWRGSRDVKWVHNITDAVLDTSDVVVVQVDWRAPAGNLYVLAVYNVHDVGNILGDFIVELHKECGIPINKFNLIGHSLGAHVSAFAGKRVYNVTNEKIAKIIALDPAGPLFSGREEDRRLSKNDAVGVFVLHTDGGKFGYQDSFGAADFYANTGSAVQPGCLSIESLSIKNITSAFFCSHARSHKYFIEIIKDPHFVGRECESYLRFSTGTCGKKRMLKFLTDDLYSKGDFYFSTNSNKPFTRRISKNESET